MGKLGNGSTSKIAGEGLNIPIQVVEAFSQAKAQMFSNLEESSRTDAPECCTCLSGTAALAGEGIQLELGCYRRQDCGLMA